MSIVKTENSQWCTTSDTGIDVLRQPNAQEWAAFGSQLSQLNRSLMWVVGDWLLIGESEGYLERGKLDAACNTFDIAYETARKSVQVCRAFESGVRIPLLSFTHHALIANRNDAPALLKWAVKNGATVTALRKEKIRRDNGKAGDTDIAIPEVPEDELTAEAKQFRDFLKFADGKPKMKIADVADELKVDRSVAKRLMFAATVHPAVDVVADSPRAGTAFVVDWTEQSASERLSAVNNKPQPKRLDEKLEQAIDSAIAVIDGFYHGHKSTFGQVKPQDPERLSVRANTLMLKVEAFTNDINTRILNKE